MVLVLILVINAGTVPTGTMDGREGGDCAAIGEGDGDGEEGADADAAGGGCD
jgi:hypothetical protein